MSTPLLLALLALLCGWTFVGAYVSWGSNRMSTQLGLFGDLFKNLGKQPKDKVPGSSPPTGAKVLGGRKSTKAEPLEKISNKQGRDWNKYTKAVEAAKQAARCH